MRPTEDFSARLKINTTRKEVIGGGSPIGSCPDGNGAPLGIPFINPNDNCKVDRTAYIVDIDPAAFPNVRNNGTPFMQYVTNFGTLEMDYTVADRLSLSSTTGYFHTKVDGMINGPNTGAAGPTLISDNQFKRRDSRRKCASRGIGCGIAERLGAAGALVAVNYAGNAEAAANVVQAIEASGGAAFAVCARLGKPGSIDSLVSELGAVLTRRTGSPGLDILVNNIGGSTVRSEDAINDDGNVVKTYKTIEVGGVIERSFGEIDIRFLDDIFDLNLFAPFLLTQALLGNLNDGGRVINISSVATRTMKKDQIVYNMSKAALEMFTRTLAKELGPRRITVNSVGPGITSTESVSARWTDPEKVKAVER